MRSVVVVVVVVGWAIVGLVVWAMRRPFDPCAGLDVSPQWLNDHKYSDRPANKLGL